MKFRKSMLFCCISLSLMLSGCTYDNRSGYTKCIITDYSGKSIEYNIKDYILRDGNGLKLFLKDGSTIDINGNYRFEK